MKDAKAAELLAEIKDELGALDRLVDDIALVYGERPKVERKRSVYDESLALKLHNFYTGCERIFTRIAEFFNGGATASGDWHKRLLKGMSLDIEGVRPAVITQNTVAALEDFLAFRHRVRNIYGFELDSDRLTALVERVGKDYAGFRKDIVKFSGFLKKLAG
jgi:hypothetical protein